MIEIKKYIDGITVTGHAGYAPIGQDIVCASISTLTETLIASLMELTVSDIKVHKEPGDVRIKTGNELTDTAELLVDSFFIGVEGVKGAYPEYIATEAIKKFMPKEEALSKI